VVERHGNAKLVAGAEIERARVEVTVVEDVVVRERRALWRAGRAARELDVDRVVELQTRRNLARALVLRAVRERRQPLELEESRTRRAPEYEDRAEIGQSRSLELAGARGIEPGGELPEHRHVIARLERLRSHESLAADLVERVVELGNAVGGVDVDEHEPDACRCKLADGPFPAIRRPDAETVPRLEPDREQPGSVVVDGLLELAPRETPVLMPHDQRRQVRNPASGLRQLLVDRAAEQWLVDRAVRVTQAHAVPSRCRFLPIITTVGPTASGRGRIRATASPTGRREPGRRGPLLQILIEPAIPEVESGATRKSADDDRRSETDVRPEPPAGRPDDECAEPPDDAAHASLLVIRQAFDTHRPQPATTDHRLLTPICSRLR
jgi:hypothetical protein